MIFLNIWIEGNGNKKIDLLVGIFYKINCKFLIFFLKN